MTEPIVYKSFDQLPVTIQAEDIAAILGISRAGAYTLMRSKCHRCTQGEKSICPLLPL